MKIIRKIVMFGVPIMCSLVFSAPSLAQNKVVVIPMSGEDLKPLANIVTVAKANGDFTDPVEAMDSISDAGSDNPYLIVIAPGIYTVASAIEMKQYVDVTGSGQNATVLVGSVSTSSRSDSAVFKGSRNSSVRSLTVRHSSTSGNRAVGFHTQNEAGMVIDDVKIEIDGSGTIEGIYALSSDFSLLNSRIEISGGSFVDGIYVSSTEINSHNNIIQISDCGTASGIYVNNRDANITGNRVSINNCTGTQEGIYVNSRVDAVVSGSSIDIASSSGNKYGVYSNSASKGLYTGLRIQVTGDSGVNYGIFNNSLSNRSRITGVDIEASTYAIRSSSSTDSNAGHTFISNAVFRDGLVDGEPTKLHCSHVFDESDPAAPVELGSHCF